MSVHNRLTALCERMKQWPQPAGKVRGVRAIQETCALSATPDETLAIMERNLPKWLAVYASKPSKYWRRLDYLMFDGDWETDPFAQQPEPPQEQPKPALTQDDWKAWYRENLKERADAEMFAAKPSTDAETRAFLLDLAETLPGEPYRPTRPPASLGRKASYFR